ncbi:hypothetical protein ROD_31531 [Citrobacter rodentium ICC168]|uniref:Uncharacterized protein n=1 Tax=Citrobacter rodentium (strain ICC168) TaxID=637910 RepID=D2TM67_CITRI|nr:hypothetical protein ROD_31531 [Citrobacter rodentium ICC168]
MSGGQYAAPGKVSYALLALLKVYFPPAPLAAVSSKIGVSTKRFQGGKIILPVNV